MSGLLRFDRHNDRRVARGRNRLRFLAIGFMIAFSSVTIRLLHMTPAPQTFPPAVAGTEGGEGERRRPDVTDRNGRLLATDLRVPSLFADPLLIQDKAAAAKQLAATMPGLDAAQLEARFTKARRFARIKHQVTPEEQEAVLQLGIPGVAFDFGEHRVYPNARLASHVLGLVDIDNEGLAGIEYGLDHGLVPPAAVQGGHVALSVDARVQEVVEDEVLRAHERFRSIGACAIVMDQSTGEVVALSSMPDFDPNRGGAADPEARLNRCTGGSYELGSIFKIMAHAMAIDTGKVSLHDRFDARGNLVIGKFRIKDDHAKNRFLSVPEIFMYSSNIGTARMVFAAGGAKPFEDFLRRAGFYEKPSVELPEVANMQLPKRWAEVTTATVSFGHGIAISPLQFVTAMTAIAGDGTYVEPTFLKHDPSKAIERRRLVSASTAADIRSLMWLTVAQGTGTRGRVEGYAVGGKTGTAEKAGRHGYGGSGVLASFAAVFPVEAPRYLVLGLLDDPKGDKATFGHRYGGWTAAPMVGAIIGRIGPLLGVPASAENAEALMAARVDPNHAIVAADVEGGTVAARSARR